MSGERLEPRLEAQGVVVQFGGRCVLDGIDLALSPGQITALVGPNGAGKSTLLACLAGLRRPERGVVRLEGRAFAAIPARERARQVGFLPQTPEIAWPIDVETLVGLGRIPYQGGRGGSQADRTAVARAIAAAGLDRLARRDVTTLSGGERARALMARVLAGQPRWILADEPLTGLDLAHQFEIAALLRDFARENGGVAITVHDLGFAMRVADRVVVLANGRVLADARPAQALTTEVMASAFRVQASWIDAPSGPLLEVAGPAHR